MNQDSAQTPEKKPYDQQHGLQQTQQDGESILNGARDEDQLDKLKDNVSAHDESATERDNVGASPSEGDN